MSNMVVMLACNDAGGNFAGEVDQITIEAGGDTLVDLEGDALSCEFRNETSLVVDGLLIAISDRREWVGNWCWDAVSMSAQSAIRLLERCRDNHWTLLEAESTLFEMWEQDRDWPARLAELLEAA